MWCSSWVFKAQLLRDEMSKKRCHVGPSAWASLKWNYYRIVENDFFRLHRSSRSISIFQLSRIKSPTCASQWTRSWISQMESYLSVTYKMSKNSFPSWISIGFPFRVFLAFRSYERTVLKGLIFISMPCNYLLRIDR